MTTETPFILILNAVKETSKVIRQGFGPLNWNSLSVEDYLERSMNAASQLDSVCKNILKTVDNVSSSIKSIKNMKLIPS